MALGRHILASYF